MAEGEIITRNHLPHWYVPGAMHFITYRLAGTLPTRVIENLRARKARLLRQKPDDLTLPAYRERVHKQLFAHYDRYLDRSHGSTWLAVPAVAAVIRKSLYYHNGGKYHLLAYCVMPNYVHVLLQPLEVAPGVVPAEQEEQAVAAEEGFGEVADAGSPLSSIMHSLKSYTANQANRLLHRAGVFGSMSLTTTGFATRTNWNGSLTTSPGTRSKRDWSRSRTSGFSARRMTVSWPTARSAAGCLFRRASILACPG
jgi:putative DNA methylase